MKRKYAVCGFVVAAFLLPLVAAVRINEICADNTESLLTAAGDAADWIELYNDSGTTVSLEDWSMTDSVSNPRRFVFPAGVSIAPGGYRIVFASGSSTPIKGGEVHANFSLSKDGEYLALIDPTGNVESAFTFPRQLQDITYGYATKDLVLIGEGSPSRFFVPDGSLNPTVYNGTGALGFASSSSQGAFTVKYYEMTESIANVDVAESRLLTPSYWKTDKTYPVVGQYPTVNFITSGNGTFGGHIPFPTQIAGQDKNYVIVAVEGGLYIPSAGLWTFAVASDDGFRLRITGQGVNFMSEYPGTRGLQPTFGTFNFPVAGIYNVDLIMFQNEGGAGLEFAVAQGNQSIYNSTVFSLVGDVAKCPVLHAGAFGAFIETNISAHMNNSNPIRTQMRSEWSFVLDEPPDPGDLFTLNLRFSDGFSASLGGFRDQGGTILAEANVPPPAPPLPGFNNRSPATTQRPVADYLTWEVIPIPTSLLTVGTNTIYIIGLRSSTTNGDFFLQPQLVQKLAAPQLMYFKDPTPGAPNAQGHNGLTPAVAISEPHGYKTDPFDVTLSCEDPAAVIRYTLNGSLPTRSNSIVYTNAIPITKTTVLRAAVVDEDSVFQQTATASWLFLANVLAQGPSAPPGWPSGSVNGQTYQYTMQQTIVNQWPVQIREGFTNCIPTLSIVMDQDDFSGAQKGIYSNPGNDGIGWERPISLELIDPERGPQKEFQFDGGLRIRGAASRGTGNPKHSLRLFFRRDYNGANWLTYPLFDEEGTDEFNRVDLRCTANGSWAQGSNQDTLIRDVYSRDCQRDLGVPYARSRPYHVFINGVYWGLYETQERAEAHYTRSYFGGGKDDWDAIKTGSNRNLNAIDGDLNALRTLWDYAVNQGFAPTGASSNNYMRVRGLNPDGTRNPAYPVYLDETNLMARVLIMEQTGDGDSPISMWGNFQNNQAMFFNRVDSDGFKWLCHDAEWSLGLHGDYPVTCDVRMYQGNNRIEQFAVSNPGLGSFNSRCNPASIHFKLLSHPDYKMHFADQIQKHFFNDGALTVANSQARWRKRMDQLGNAIVAESARWGGGSRTVNTWTNECNFVLNTYLAQRNAIILSQFKTRGWFPNLAAPTRTPTDNVLAPGTPVIISATDAFAYTLDGTDPRLPGGAISPAATIVGQIQVGGTQTLVTRGAVWQYYDNGNTPPNNNAVTWKDPPFDASAWQQGPAILGFAGSTTVNPVATQTKRYVNGISGTQVTTTYFRHTFTVSDVSQITSLTAEILRDDGAIVYLNGTEILRENMNPGTPDYNTWAASNLGSPAQNTYYTYALPPQYLQPGPNVLAVEVHQSNANSTDLYLDFSLTATLSSNGGGGPHTQTIVAQSNHVVMARAFNGAEWSPLAEMTFSTEPPPHTDYTKLRVSKLMYAPTDPLPTEVLLAPDATNRDDYAWFELCNTDPTAPLDLTGVTIPDAVTVNATLLNGITLPPLGRILLVKNTAAFAARYPDNTRQTIAWNSGNLARSGETFSLKNPGGLTMWTFTYDGDNWFAGAAKNTGRWLDAADLGAPLTAWSTEAGWTLNGFHEAPLVSEAHEATPLPPLTNDFSFLRVSKLMYAPPDPTPPEADLLTPTLPTLNRDHFAWFELCNRSDTHSLDLTGVTMDDAVNIGPPLLHNLTLPPLGRVYIVKSLPAFHARYPANTQLALQWDSGNLARSGETLTLKAPGGTPIHTFTYDGDNWFSGAAKNTGRWLDAAHLDAPPPAWSTQAGWRLNSPYESPLTPLTGETPPYDDYTALRISKLMFAPPDPTPDEIAAGGHTNVDRYAWLELTNTGTNDLNLGGVLLSNNIECALGDVTLLPGARYLLCKNKATFDIRYPEGPPPNDTGRDRKNWDDGNISRNGGEDKSFDLYAPDGTLIYSLTYDGGWFNGRASGTGRWLEAKDLGLTDLPLWSEQDAWRLNPVNYDYTKLRVSRLMFAPTEPTPAEIAAGGHTNVNRYAWLEITNTGENALNLSGVQVTNNIEYTFGNVPLPPGGRIILCRQQVSFQVRHPLGPPPNDTGRPHANWNDTNLSRNGGQPIELCDPDGNLIYAFTYWNHWLDYGAYNTGRWLDANDLGLTDLALWSTEGAWKLSSPLIPYDYAQLRISKFMYGAYSPSEDEAALGFDSVDHFAWLELYNAGDAEVDLANVSLYGVTHRFSPYLLQPRARLVIAKSAEAFTARYPTDGIDLIQWTGGNLSQNGELIELYAPDGATHISFTYDNNWYGLTNTGHYLVAADLTVPQTDAWWSTAPAWRPSATSNAVPGHAERPLISAPRMDDQCGRTFRFNVSNLDGTLLDVLYSPDLSDWAPCDPLLWTRGPSGIITINLDAPPLQSQDKAFFRLRQR